MNRPVFVLMTIFMFCLATLSFNSDIPRKSALVHSCLAPAMKPALEADAMTAEKDKESAMQYLRGEISYAQFIEVAGVQIESIEVLLEKCLRKYRNTNFLVPGPRLSLDVIAHYLASNGYMIDPTSKDVISHISKLVSGKYESLANIGARRNVNKIKYLQTALNAGLEPRYVFKKLFNATVLPDFRGLVIHGFSAKHNTNCKIDFQDATIGGLVQIEFNQDADFAQEVNLSNCSINNLCVIVDHDDTVYFYNDGKEVNGIKEDRNTRALSYRIRPGKNFRGNHGMPFLADPDESAILLALEKEWGIKPRGSYAVTANLSWNNLDWGKEYPVGSVEFFWKTFAVVFKYMSPQGRDKALRRLLELGKTDPEAAYEMIRDCMAESPSVRPLRYSNPITDEEYFLLIMRFFAKDTVDDLRLSQMKAKFNGFYNLMTNMVKDPKFKVYMAMMNYYPVLLNFKNHYKSRFKDIEKYLKDVSKAVDDVCSRFPKKYRVKVESKQTIDKVMERVVKIALTEKKQKKKDEILGLLNELIEIYDGTKAGAGYINRDDEYEYSHGSGDYVVNMNMNRMKECVEAARDKILSMPAVIEAAA